MACIRNHEIYCGPLRQGDGGLILNGVTVVRFRRGRPFPDPMVTDLVIAPMDARIITDVGELLIGDRVAWRHWTPPVPGRPGRNVLKMTKVSRVRLKRDGRLKVSFGLFDGAATFGPDNDLFLFACRSD